MNKTQKALKLAIEQMQHLIKIYIPSPEWSGTAIQEDCYETIRACKEALAQPAQEPYGWEYAGAIWNDKDEVFGWHEKHKLEQNPPLPLYIHPAPAWQGLSDAEILDRAAQIMVERHYKEKNT